MHENDQPYDLREYLEEKLAQKNRPPGQEDWPQEWIDYDKRFGPVPEEPATT